MLVKKNWTLQYVKQSKCFRRTSTKFVTIGCCLYGAYSLETRHSRNHRKGWHELRCGCLDHVDAPPGILQEDFIALVGINEKTSTTQPLQQPSQAVDTQAGMVANVQFPQYPYMYGIPRNKPQQANHRKELNTEQCMNIPVYQKQCMPARY